MARLQLRIAGIGQQQHSDAVSASAETPLRTWHMVVADDHHLEAGRPAYRSALMVFFVLCAVSGVPLAWHKTLGGDVVSWVGFELLHHSRSWFINWTREVAAAEHVLMSSFEKAWAASCTLPVL